MKPALQETECISDVIPTVEIVSLLGIVKMGHATAAQVRALNHDDSPGPIPEQRVENVPPEREE